MYLVSFDTCRIDVVLLLSYISAKPCNQPHLLRYLGQIQEKYMKMYKYIFIDLMAM